MSDKNRTLQQNKSIHLYCDLLAKELNSAGYDIRETLRKDIEIPWTMILVKELIWKKVQSSAFNITSTTKLSSSQVSDIYMIIDRFTREKFGVGAEFPSNLR